MEKYRVSAVSYLNTWPFLYGLQRSEQMSRLMDLSVDYPALCAKKVLNGQVDIGLVPVVILRDNPHLDIVSDYCIGADGNVNSVFLLSDRPLDQITEIYLDYQSKTSVNLVKVLARHFWKIKPQWLSTRNGFENKRLRSIVIIGDRAFKYRNKYNYVYDLAGEWKKFTGLPFVFAVWAANKHIDNNFIRDFNFYLSTGLSDIDGVINYYRNQIPSYISQEQLRNYLLHDIDYKLDEKKFQAIDLFFELLEDT